MADVFYFEDLTPGQTFKTGSRTLDAAAIKAFARDYDPQPFHTDEATAKPTFFGELVASGWHTARRPCACSSRGSSVRRAVSSAAGR